MIHIITSTVPALLFMVCVVVIYLRWAGLWGKWLFGRRRSADAGKILTTRPAVCLHVLAGTGIVCILYGYFVEPRRLEINHVTVETDKLQNACFRVVQISDLHCDTKARLETTLPDAINALNPDLIVFTGDSLNRASALELFQSTLQRLNAPLAKYAVQGNWDANYWDDLNLFDNTGFAELSGCRHVEKDGETIAVSGLSFDRNPSVDWALASDRFNLFLYHTTDLVDTLAGQPVDLYLCGHTHGGQIALPLYGALVTLSRHGKKYEAGLYRLGGMQIYVNRGIGMEGGRAPRVRFLARPEITVFDIVPRGRQAEDLSEI